MYKSQKGFTLIELVVVIVLLGILGVTALARFQNLSADAQTAANQGLASELSAGSSINFAQRSLNNTVGAALNVDNIVCADLADPANALALLTTAPPVADFTITNTVAGSGDCLANGPGSTFTCDVVSTSTPSGATALATIICTP